MYFIAILIMFGLLQYWGSFAAFQKDDWFAVLLERSQAMMTNSWLVYVVSVLLPCLFLVAILASIKDWMWGAVSLLLAVFTLVYSLGRKEYKLLIQEYINNWKNGNYENLPVIIKQLDPTYMAELGEGLQQNHIKARESYIYAAFEGLFAVLFWFVLIGPAGALLYRLNSFFLEKTQWRMARNIQSVLEWPAAFLLGLTFTLMGDFGQGISTWRSTACNMGMTSKNVVHANALAATGLTLDWLKGEFNDKHTLEEQAKLAESEMQTLVQLVRRSLGFAIFVIAIFEIVI